MLWSPRVCTAWHGIFQKSDRFVSGVVILIINGDGFFRIISAGCLHNRGFVSFRVWWKNYITVKLTNMFTAGTTLHLKTEHMLPIPSGTYSSFCSSPWSKTTMWMAGMEREEGMEGMDRWGDGWVLFFVFFLLWRVDAWVNIFKLILKRQHWEMINIHTHTVAKCSQNKEGVLHMHRHNLYSWYILLKGIMT